MKNYILKAALITVLSLCSTVTFAKDKVTVLLDWFVNPDHAALIVAKQKGFFAAENLDVEFIEPADPSMPPKLVAAGKGDLAVDYQPQLQMSVDAGLPIKRIATLIDSPLNTLTVLKKSKIKTIADLKGKTIGYSVSGIEQSLLAAMLATEGLTLKDVKMINVNFSLAPALITGKVDAVIGGYRNFELNTLALEGRPGRAFYVEKHGVPSYDELVLISAANKVNDPRFKRFVTALEKATIYTKKHPKQAWHAFQSYKPNDLDNALNRRAWNDTVPLLATHPRSLNKGKYQRMAQFLQRNGIIKTVKPVSTYAVQLAK
ncbi:ABC transporter substrate-binding protein [Psychrobacter pygoscelis]|uniref:ABC transporter substrate-binding protein n=1 Tax=Psychrobacter pygoscelis TaxID=2488563 RepID=UPI001040D6D0|nr:ABC transporter substrate-binding protein [Psychrobacter pygoscelis]